MTTAESLQGLSEWVNMHSRALGLTFTGYFIITFGAGYATHLKCEARRVETLREMDEKHEAMLRKANDAKLEAAKFRVLTVSEQ